MNGIMAPIVFCSAGIVLAGSAFGQSEFQRIAILSGDYSGLPSQNAPNGPEFGHSVAMDGDWMAVGAPGTLAEFSGNVGETGAVFLFQRQDDDWHLRETIIISGQRCGSAVALSFPHLAFGCPSAIGDSRVQFRTFAPSENSWERTGGFSTGAHCGVSIAMTGVHAVTGTAMAAIGCPGHFSGSVRIREFDPDDTSISPLGRWNSVQSLSPSDGVIGDRFGASVAFWHSDLTLTHRTLAVGAPNKSHGNSHNSGSVYLFEGSNWTETNSLIDPEAPHNGYIRSELEFGASLAVNETELFIGAPGPGWQGSVAYYRRAFPGNPWAYQISNNAVNMGGDPEGEQLGMRFGDAVALGPGNLVAVAAPHADGIHQESGEVELRRPELQIPFGYTLVYRGEVRPGHARPGQIFEQGHFGTSVDFGKGQLAVGFPHVGSGSARFGQVWVYEIDGIFADRFEE
jgi:hypothetical protein